ncbi:MAG: hypothetical protein P0Y64_00235 [Candidatus Sphingomonas colombiensis]|nr:hypothetical protein [Sphingomonas sp.]WEK43335.1 MAG: hypothetical protein P0Y64_00235 [Sphingomonas sp.]
MKSAILAAISAAALASGGMAYAQAPAAKATTAAHTTVATKTTTVTKPAMASSNMMAAKTTHVTRKATSTPAGRMVTTKTSTGKTVTYNCSKAGNANKKACK